MRFLPRLWADGRRSFPRTQLAFSIWVPDPLLTPYSQNTFSSHRNPSNLHYIRASRITAALYAQSPECLIAKRVSQASTSLSAQPPGHTSLPMGTHKLSITSHFSKNSRRRTKLSLGSSVRRLLMPVLYSGISIQCLNLQPSGMVSGSLSK